MGVHRYVEIAEEGTFAVEATTVSKEVLDPEVADLDSGQEDKAVWQGISNQDRHIVYGPYSCQGNLNVLADKKAAPRLWRWFLGGYAVTGAGPYDHVFTPDLTSLMKSFSTRIGKDAYQHEFYGCVINTLSFMANDQFVRMNCGVLGAKDFKAAIQDPAPAFTEGDIYAPHDVTITVDAGDQSAIVEQVSLEMSNNLNMEEGRTVGSRFARRVYRNAFSCIGNLQLSFTDTAQLEKFWGTATGPATTGTPNDVELILNIGADYSVTLGRGVYMSFGKPISGRNRIVQPVTMRFLQDVAGANPLIQVDIQNTVTTYVPA